MSSGDSPLLPFLTCDLPAGYPFEPALTPDFIAIMKERHRKEIVRQQTGFLELGKQCLPTHPWLGYLTALKHDALLTFVPIETTPFVNVTDQKEFSDCQHIWLQLRNESRRAIEDPIAFFCERLVLLQREAPKIDDLERSLQGALAAGFTALLPLAETPPELPKGVGADLAGAFGFNKARREAEARIKAWHHQDSYLQLSLKTLSKMSSLSLETRTHGLKDVAGLLGTLNELREERDVLIATYLTPFLGQS